MGGSPAKSAQFDEKTLDFAAVKTIGVTGLRRTVMRRMWIGLVAVATACGSSTASPATTTTTTVATSTTSEATTTSTSTIPPSTTTTAVPDWTPPCAPLEGGSTPTGAYNEVALDKFGPLAAQPNLTIDLPTGPPLEGNPNEAPDVLVTRIEGGVLLAVVAGSGGASKSSILAAVNTDGSKRWVRCIDGHISGVFVAPPATQPTTATVAVVRDYPSSTSTAEWPIVSLADGSDQGSLADVAHSWAYPIYPKLAGTVLLASGKTLFGDIEQFALYDLVTSKMTTIPVPPEIATFAGGLEVSDAGELALTNGPRVLAVYQDGAWKRDPPTLRKAFGIRPFFESEAPSRLVGIDALGKTVWAEDNFFSAAMEGTAIGTDGGVTVADVCTSGPVGNCTAYALVGVDTSNGKLLWGLPGFRLVSAHANGYVLTTNDATFDPTGQSELHPGWVLLDDRTGKLVDQSQQWTDPDTFRFGCCGEGETVWVDHAGGVVIVVNNTRVGIWYPQAAAAETHRLSIP